MPPTVRSLWQSFWKLPLFARTLLWSALCWVLFLPVWFTRPDKKHPEIVWSLLGFFVLWGLIIYVVRASIEKMLRDVRQGVQRKANATAMVGYSRPEPHLQHALDSHPHFRVAQWCILPVPGGARGLAVNETHTQVAVLDYANPRSLSEQPAIAIKIYEAGDVLRAEVDEDSFQQTQISTVTQTKGQSQAKTGSMIGRAIVGGVLLGPTGAIIGGATAGRRQTSTGITTGTHTAHTRVRRLELKLTVNNPGAPLERLPFLLGEVDKNDTDYATARANADHWLALFDIMSHRRNTNHAQQQQGYSPASNPYTSPPDPYTGGRLF